MFTITEQIIDDAGRYRVRVAIGRDSADPVESVFLKFVSAPTPEEIDGEMVALLTAREAADAAAEPV